MAIKHINTRNALVKWRYKLALYPSAIADAIGVSESTYKSWELGYYLPKAQHAKELISFFHKRNSKASYEIEQAITEDRAAAKNKSIIL